MKKKKILLITNIFPPHIGGPATFIDRLAHHLSSRGHKVTVICSSDKRQEISDLQRPFIVNRVCIAVRELYEILIRINLFIAMARHRYILVNGLETYVAQISRLLRKRYLLKIVGDSAWEVARNRGTTLLAIDDFQKDGIEQKKHESLIKSRNNGVRQAAHIFTPSHYLKNMIVGWGVEPQRVSVINNGIEFLPMPEGLKRRSTKELKAVFVGRLTNWKGVETILLAMCELDNILVDIIGDGPEYPLLFSLAHQLGIADKVKFLGKKDQTEVMKTLSQSHVLILTSLYEGLSHTLLEAMSIGLPCIASNIGGNQEVINDGENGLLIPAQSVTALRESLKLLQQNEDYRFKLCQGALQRASHFKLTTTVQEITILIERQL